MRRTALIAAVVVVVLPAAALAGAVVTPGTSAAGPPVAIPVPAAGLRPALVVAPAQGVAHLRLQGFLHDLADGQPEQLGPRVTVRHPFLQRTVGRAIGQRRTILSC